MGKLIFNAQSTPVAPVGENKHTMFVDSCDGKLKMEDSNGSVCEFITTINTQEEYFGNGSDGECHITCSDADCIGNVFMCSGCYNFTNFIVDSGVKLWFCGETPVVIKANCCICNLGIINTRGTVVCNCGFFLEGIGGITNTRNKGTLCDFVYCEGVNECYCNGCNGSTERYGIPVGGNSYWCNGGCGGYNNCCQGGGNGGCSFYGNGGPGHNGDYTNGRGGDAYVGDGGCGAGGSRGAGNGGDSLGGAYGLYIGAPSICNICIYAKGGNGGIGGNLNHGCELYRAQSGCGADGGNVYVIYKDVLNSSSINVNGGDGNCCNKAVDGKLFIGKIK